MMRFIVLMIALLGLTFIFCTCKNHATQPPPPSGPDTTSHNFTWTKNILGDGSGSSFYDVAIINDTLAYAVGAIYLKDSTGSLNPNAFNAIKWDGHNWELKRIPFVGNCSAVLYPQLKAIWAFSNDNILVTNGGSIVRYDGINAIMDCSMNTLLAGAITKIFATSPKDIYLVGNRGTLVHYNGGNWMKIESGTTLPINDIWGTYNSTTGQWEILAVAGDAGSSYDRKILQISGTKATSISDSTITLSLNSVWFVPNQHYYVVGDGIYDKSALSDRYWNVHLMDITTYYTTRVRGQAANDVFIVGAFGEVLHYNGSTWCSYMSTTGLPDGCYGSLAVMGNIVIAVGATSTQAVAVMGRRN